MDLNRIKEYLRLKKIDFDDDIIKQLGELKKSAVKAENEKQANEIWCLEMVSNIQKMYLNMFALLKKGEYDNYFSAWRLLERIDIDLAHLRGVFHYAYDEFYLDFIGNIIRQYEKLFPYEYFMSRETIIKKVHCSICGKINTIRNHCEHQVGKIYMGEMCCNIVDDFEFLGMAIVKKPFDKYTVLFPEGKRYNYFMLDGLMTRIDDPYSRWYVEILEQENPIYKNVGRNDKCPCGSGKKYKKCCLGTKGTVTKHHKIILIDNTDVEPLPLTVGGTWEN